MHFAHLGSVYTPTSVRPIDNGKKSIGWGSQPRTLKTVFGEVHFSVPRQKYQDCQQTFSVSTPLLETTHPLDDSNVTQTLRKIAILCGSSWSFRQAANVLFELTGVRLSFGHIRWLCADEAEVVAAQANTTYEHASWEALAETMEVLVEYLADEPKQPMVETPYDSHDKESSGKRTYMGIDGTFVNAQPDNFSLETGKICGVHL